MATSFEVAKVINRNGNRAQVVVHFKDETTKKIVASMTRHVQRRGLAWEGRNTDTSCRVHAVAAKALEDTRKEVERLQGNDRRLAEELKKLQAEAPTSLEAQATAALLLKNTFCLAEAEVVAELTEELFKKVAAEHPLTVTFKGM